MTMDGRCWDGNWMTDGHDGMFIDLSRDSFCDDEMDDFLEEQEESDSQLQMEHEFLKIPMDGDENQWARIHMEILHPRNLVVAAGVMRLCAQDSCPSQIRIQKIHPKEMKGLLASKKRGNEEFSKQNYATAIEYYDDALMFSEALYVAPADEVQQVVNVLSNQAECHLRLKQYEDAGNAATAALLLDNSHEKSRMRRAKAEMAIAGSSFLIQAQVDLQEIVDENHSSTGVKQAKQYLEELEEIITMEKTLFQKTNPDGDWALYVRMFKATCW
ncbi:MAG: hypothetical protein SGBAC_011890 [Bacillariaceae sp.]